MQKEFILGIIGNDLYQPSLFCFDQYINDHNIQYLRKHKSSILKLHKTANYFLCNYTRCKLEYLLSLGLTLYIQTYYGSGYHARISNECNSKHDGFLKALIDRELLGYQILWKKILLKF